jgi:hypothetical protein
MSRTIRIDSDVEAALRNLTKGFESPNTVIRRVLGLPKPEKKAKVKPPKDGARPLIAVKRYPSYRLERG